MSEQACEEWLRCEVERLELRLATLEGELEVARLENARLRDRPPRPARAPAREAPGEVEIARRSITRLALRNAALAAALREARPGHPLICNGPGDKKSNENLREKPRQSRA